MMCVLHGSVSLANGPRINLFIELIKYCGPGWRIAWKNIFFQNQENSVTTFVWKTLLPSVFQREGVDLITSLLTHQMLQALTLIS